MKNKRSYKKKIYNIMNGGAQEEGTPNSSGWSMFKMFGNKDEDNKNKSVVSNIESEAKTLLGMPQKGESKASHLDGEIDELKKKKLELENKFKEDSQKIIEENKKKQESDIKKLKDDFTKNNDDINTKINDLEKQIKELIEESKKNISDAEGRNVAPETTLTTPSLSGGRRGSTRKSQNGKKYTRKNRYSRKKKHYKKTRSKKH